jgi:Helicase conserved C-terminal domain
MMEITKAIDELHKKPFFQSPAVKIHPLHSSLSTSEQTAVFDVPEAGVRKIVVATNVSANAKSVTFDKNPTAAESLLFPNCSATSSISLSDCRDQYYY